MSSDFNQILSFFIKKRPRQVYLGLIGFNQLKMLSEQRGCHGQGKCIE